MPQTPPPRVLARLPWQELKLPEEPLGPLLYKQPSRGTGHTQKGPSWG